LTQEEQPKALYLANVITWPSLPVVRVKTGGEYRELVWNGRENSGRESIHVPFLWPQSRVKDDPVT